MRSMKYFHLSVSETGKHRMNNHITEVPSRYNIVHSLKVRKNSDLSKNNIHILCKRQVGNHL